MRGDQRARYKPADVATAWLRRPAASWRPGMPGRAASVAGVCPALRASRRLVALAIEPNSTRPSAARGHPREAFYQLLDERRLRAARPRRLASRRTPADLTRIDCQRRHRPTPTPIH